MDRFIKSSHLCRAVVAVTAVLAFVNNLVSAAPPLVGLNFSENMQHPVNWTVVTSVQSGLVDLIAEDGSPTIVDFTFAAGEFDSGTIEPNSIPTHDPSLGSLDGNVYDLANHSAFIGLFSDLIPNQDYYLWVIGARFDSTIGQHVSVFGSGRAAEFNQVGPANSLFINGEIGSNTRTLESYAMIVNATDGGTITLVVNPLPHDNGATYAVSAIALQPVPEPSSWLLAASGIALAGWWCRRRRRSAAGQAAASSSRR